MEMSDQLNVPELAWRKISLLLPGFQPRTVQGIAKSGTEFLRKKKQVHMKDLQNNSDLQPISRGNGNGLGVCLL